MLNGAWDPHEFVTFCISRENENTRAFFGYQDYHIVNANATWMKAGPAYDMQTSNSTDRPPSDLKDTESQRSVKNGQAVSAKTRWPGQRIAVSATDDGVIWRVKDIFQCTSSPACSSNIMCPVRACLSGLLRCRCHQQPLPSGCHLGPWAVPLWLCSRLATSPFPCFLLPVFPL